MECIRGGVAVITGEEPVDLIEVCGTSQCYQKIKPTKTLTFLFPLQILISTKLFQVAVWAAGRNIWNRTESCSITPFCEQLEGLISFDRILNPQCWSAITTRLVLFAIYVISIALIAIAKILTIVCRVFFQRREECTAHNSLCLRLLLAVCKEQQTRIQTLIATPRIQR